MYLMKKKTFFCHSPIFCDISATHDLENFLLHITEIQKLVRQLKTTTCDNLKAYDCE